MILMFQVCFVFGQTPQWSSWGKVSCFQGFQFAVLNKGYVKSINQYSWQAKIKSNYNKKVTFNMSWKVGAEVVSIGQITLSPGQEYSHTSRYFNSNVNYLSVEVSSVNFSDKLNCYAICDNGVPNQPNCDTKTNTGANTTNTNSQAYDPTFDRNNASFQDYYKRATAAGQAGNYDQAISLWNSAISVAVNDAQRNNAKAWLAEAQKAKASSTTSNNNYQQQQIAQQQAQQQALLKQQQALQKQQQLQQGITQLADGITGLVSSIQANKEKKRLEEQQRAIAAKQKALEEEMANSKALVDAENGDFSGQRKVADKAFADSEYDKAENYYALAIQNGGSDKNQKAYMLDNYLSSLALQGKRKEYFYIINDLKKEKNSFTYSHNLLFALSQIFCNDFPSESMDCNDENIGDGIKKLTTITWGIAPIVVNYLQATGLYTQYGISSDTKTAFEALEKRAERKYPEKAASYYLGMIYLNGTASIKANDRKALNYFTDAINYETKDIGKAPAFSTNNGQGYFNYRLLAYVKIAQILSRKSGNDDQEMSKRMLRSFYKWYKPMIPNADLVYFKEFEAK